MKNIFQIIGVVLLFLFSNNLIAQGPPITADKPIMLGGKTKLIKTLSEVRKTNTGTFVAVPLMVHYLPSSNTLIGIHIPLVHADFKDNLEEPSTALGDISLLAKYQFYRKDQMGKTFRIVAKTLQTFPTGKALGVDGISMGQYQSYQGIVAGYESIKYGISNELGFNYIPKGDKDELRYKLGFGLPLKKSTYPVNQLNLYFEYQNSWFVNTDEYLLLYAQGIQYAKGRITVEASVQFPLVQKVSVSPERVYSLLFGTRIVI